MIPTMKATIALVFAALVLGACNTTNPAPEDLYGLWVNVDDGDGMVRAFEFADSSEEAGLEGVSPVYRLYVYAELSDVVEVQRGSYDVVEDHLVQTILWDVNTALVGQTFGNEIYGFNGRVLELESGSSATGARNYESAEQLP